jgi:hypothetical protein
MSTERPEPGEDELLPPPPPPPDEDEDWRRPPGTGWDGDVPEHGPYQPMRELDSEDGPPPRRGGPTG